MMTKLFPTGVGFVIIAGALSAWRYWNVNAFLAGLVVFVGLGIIASSISQGWE